MAKVIVALTVSLDGFIGIIRLGVSGIRRMTDNLCQNPFVVKSN